MLRGFGAGAALASQATPRNNITDRECIVAEDEMDWSSKRETSKEARLVPDLNEITRNRIVKDAKGKKRFVQEQLRSYYLNLGFRTPCDRNIVFRSVLYTRCPGFLTKLSTYGADS